MTAIKDSYTSGEELPAADVNAMVQFFVRSAYYGDGNDGNKTISSNENLDPDTVYEYETFTLNASTTMSVDEANKPLVVRVRGDATINGTIDLDEQGTSTGNAALGIGAIVSSGTNGGNGVGGTNWGGAAGGGGGGNIWRQGSSGTQGGDNGGTKGIAGTGGVAYSNAAALIAALGLPIACGSKGGDGGDTDDATPGTGGYGGGAMIMFVGGDLSLGAASVITADGANGTAGVGGTSNNTAGGGGGGAGGIVIIIVQGSITDSGLTLSASAGSGGAGSGGAGSGGAGATGKIIVYSIKDSTVITN